MDVMIIIVNRLAESNDFVKEKKKKRRRKKELKEIGHTGDYQTNSCII